MTFIELLLISVVLILALFATNISDKTGMPSLLLFLGLGILASFVGIDFNDYEIGEEFASLALVVIMFYGGFGTNWTMGKPVVVPAVILASLGVIATALLTGAFLHFILGFPFLESMLLGSVVGSTDFASVSNILTSKNLNLKYNTASLLELESGSNDPTAYTMTMLFLSLVMGSDVSIPIMVAKQVVLGIGMGFLFAFVVKKIHENFNFSKDGLSIVFMAGMALLTYSLTGVLGGNGYLAAYIFGIVIGNSNFVGKRDVVFFFDGLTELMSIGLFFVLGLLADLNQIISNLPLALIVMLFLTFIARPLAVFGLMAPFRMKLNQLLTISWAGLRGAAAIAFAIMVVNAGTETTLDIYHVVFGICFLSSLIQGSFMAPISKKVDMLDPSDTVLKTFNYYQDKGSVGFLQTTIQPQSGLVGTKVNQLNLTFDFIVAKIDRDGKTVIPRGSVELAANDRIVLAGQDYFDAHGDELIEFTIPKDHEWIGKRIMDLRLPENRIILTVQRANEEFAVPEGRTRIVEGDTVIMLQDDHVDFEEGKPEDEKVAPKANEKLDSEE